MHDIKFIRNNSEQFRKQMIRRGLQTDTSSILEIDKSIRNKTRRIKGVWFTYRRTRKFIGFNH